ncbi:MAG: FadR family transcriptional regulator [Burkholderiaceae bacterium]|nr:FadR family transcriptional regulator [Burkholderiaceae bacterium]
MIPMPPRRIPSSPKRESVEPLAAGAMASVGGASAVTGQVLRFIEEHGLSAGERLPSERDLAARLNVSRPALRESLATLEAMRLITRKPNSGIYLTGPNTYPSFESVVLRSDHGLALDRDTIIHSMEVRNLLELQAIELACERRTGADLEHLASIVEQTKRQLEAKCSILDLDEAFHLGVVAASHNPVFVQIVHSFYRLSIVRRRVYFSDLRRCQRSHNEHRAILRAISARDMTTAREAMRKHIHEGFWRSILRSPSRAA